VGNAHPTILLDFYYVRYDTCTNQEKNNAGKYYTLDYALKNKPSIWNFEHPILDKLKIFFNLFNNSPL
jgi:hypothetical protein